MKVYFESYLWINHTLTVKNAKKYCWFIFLICKNLEVRFHYNNSFRKTQIYVKKENQWLALFRELRAIKSCQITWLDFKIDIDIYSCFWY